MVSNAQYDVLVLGEVLVELSSPHSLSEGRDFKLSFSGDALNGAAAAAQAGASVGIVTRVAQDELGDALVNRVAELGIATDLIQRVPGQHGVYFVMQDPGGTHDFVYVRRGSAAAGLGPGDLPEREIAAARSLLVGGIACAISDSCAAAVERAATLVSDAGGLVLYDPNFRRRLTSPEEGAAALQRVAPLASVITPSCPADTEPLLGTDDPATAAARCRELGAAAVAVTCGEDGVYADLGDGPVHLPPMRARSVVDTTGAGDVLAGTTAARLALGDPLLEALHLGMAAATLSLSGAGGTGRLATLVQSRELARRRPPLQTAAGSPNPTA